ncbi:MAG: T9SS type A sorting domain-containing protein [Lentimicrobium sp.]|nr:T9SS type A sorting domain-containing protein [Lentimicrobium sp.]
MGQYERSRRSLRWSAHRLFNNGRGLHHGHISQQKVEGRRWKHMKKHYPSQALISKIHLIHVCKRFDRALACMQLPVETAFEKRFKQRMTLSFNVFRLAASFFFTLMLGNLYAAVDHTKELSAILYLDSAAQYISTTVNDHGPDARKPFSCSLPEKGSIFKASLENTIHIDGNVRGIPNNNVLGNVKVVAVNPEDNSRVDSAYTDASGNYGLTFLWTNNRTQGLESRVEAYPNPYSGSTSIDVVSERNQNYILRVFNAMGRLLFENNVELGCGENTLTLNGGPKGVNIISLDDGVNKNSYKTVKLNDDNKNFDVIVASSDFSGYFKSGNNGISDGSDLRLEFSYPNTNPRDSYQAADTTFVLRLNQTIDKKLQQELITDEFFVNAYTILDGTPVLNGTGLKVTWGDGTTNNYSSQNGLIHILRTSYDSTTNIFFENADTAFYQEWIFGTKTDPTITYKEKNLFQSPNNELNLNDPYVPPGPAPVNLNNLPGSFDVYFVPKIVFDGVNISYDTRGIDFRTVVRCRGPPFFTKKWEYVPEVADTIYMFQMQIYNRDITQPITSEESQKMKQAMDSTVTLFTLNNGRQLMPPYKRVNIYTMTEPEWIEGQARGGDQTHITEYAPYNQNGCYFTYNYAMTDKSRFKSGVAGFTRQSNIGYKKSELVGSLTNAHDPPVGNLGGLISYGNGSSTSFGKVATHLIWLSDPETKF